MNISRFLILIFVAFFAVSQAGFSHDAWAAKKKKRSAPAVDRSAAFIVDANTGKVLFSKNPDKRLHPASLTKMMTLYLTFVALEAGKLDLNTRLTTSAHAASAAPTNLALDPGDVITVEQCIKGLVTRSANDAAAVLAEAISGSESDFAILMTATARKLGMKNTTFRNASGLPNPTQISTARDMSVLARALIKHFPQYYPYFSTRSFTFNGVTYGTHNHLMKRYEGMDGIKTGYTNASGFNLVSTAKHGNTRLIGVVFGGKTAASRDAYMEQIMDNAFAKAKSPTGEIMTAANTAPPVAVTDPAEDTNAQGDIDTETTTTVTTTDIKSSTNPVVYDDSGNTAATPVTTQITTASSNTVNVLKMPNEKPPTKKVAASSNLLNSGTPKAKKNSWTIQIGAYAKKQDTDRAIQIAKKALPILLGNAKSEISQVKNSKGSKLYRARLTGLDQLTANQVCSAYKKAGKDCLTLPPSS